MLVLLLHVFQTFESNSARCTGCFEPGISLAGCRMVRHRSEQHRPVRTPPWWWILPSYKIVGQIDHPQFTSDLSRPKQTKTHIGDRLHIFPQFLQLIVSELRCQMRKEMPFVSELMQRLGDSNVFGDRKNLGVFDLQDSHHRRCFFSPSSLDPAIQRPGFLSRHGLWLWYLCGNLPVCLGMMGGKPWSTPSRNGTPDSHGQIKR